MLFFFSHSAPTELYPLPQHRPLRVSRSSEPQPPLPFARARGSRRRRAAGTARPEVAPAASPAAAPEASAEAEVEVEDRKSTRLNSRHANISYAVFCLKKTNITSVIYG